MVTMLVGGLSLPAHPVVIAQEATPATPATSGRAGALDLAAMAPVAEELPPGFGRGYGGSYIPGSLFGDVYASEIDPAALAATGLQRSFEDYYGTFDAPITIGIFIDEYATAEGAAAGFALFEDETVAAPDVTILSTTDLPGPDVGEEPKEISVTTSLYPDGITVQEVAATFRIGNLNAGVWEERYTFPDESGTPVAAVATPSTPDPEQLQHVQDLAVTLAARIDAVRAGETPPGIDPMLAARVLPLGQVPDIALGQTWEGYRDGPVVLGFEGSLAPLASDVLGGYGRSISLGVGPETPPPYIGITVSELTSPEAAVAVLDAIRAAPGDLPTPGNFPRGSARDLLPDPAIPGADQALAFSAALDEDDPHAAADSVRVVFVAGPMLASVDVQGVASVEAALAAAEALAAQQAACLMAEGPCTAVTLPPLRAAGEATPAA
jgi:hypothetical protein